MSKEHGAGCKDHDHTHDHDHEVPTIEEQAIHILEDAYNLKSHIATISDAREKKQFTEAYQKTIDVAAYSLLMGFLEQIAEEAKEHSEMAELGELAEDTLSYLEERAAKFADEISEVIGDEDLDEEDKH